MTIAATATGIRDVDTQTHVGLADSAVTALIRADEGRWIAVVDRTTVLVGAPAGGWETAAETPGPGLTCLAAAGDTVLVGSEEARVFRLEVGGDTEGGLVPVEGFNDAPGRDDWYTPWGGPPAVRSVAVGGDGAWYVNVHVGGILRSDDGGASFTQLVDPDVDVHQVITVEGLLAAACGAGGVMLSDDAGDSWRTVTGGLHATYCRAVTVCDGTLIASASTGPRTEQGAIYRMPLDAEDQTFERCRLGLPEWLEGNVDTAWLHAQDEQVAFAAPGGRIYLSSDGGGTWMLVDGGLEGVSAVVVEPGSRRNDE